MLKIVTLAFAAVAFATPVCAEELPIAPSDQPIAGHVQLTNGPSALVFPGPLDSLRMDMGLGGVKPALPPFTLNLSTTSVTPFLAQHPWLGGTSVLGRSFNPFALPMPTMYRFGFGFRR